MSSKALDNVIKLNGLPVNVKKFGAKGDGVTDDTAAIQAALNTNAAVVYLPPGNYKTTDTIFIRAGQSLTGVFISYDPNISEKSVILFRPATTPKAAIKNFPGGISAGGQSVCNIVIDSNNSANYGVQFASTYGNVIDGLQLKGTFDVGILLHDTYVCEINRVVITGATCKRFHLYIGDYNVIVVNQFHTSSFPADAAVCLYGIGVGGGGQGITLNDPILQGQTIGIALNISCLSTIINNAYFENTLVNLRTGVSGTGSSGAASLQINGGVWGQSYPSHPQYASRGPVIWLRQARSVSINNARFNDAPNAASATGPWSVLTADGTRDLALNSCDIFTSPPMRDLVMRETAGASPSVTMTGGLYGTYNATEFVMKADGAYGATHRALRVDNAGTITADSYVPAVIGGTPAALISSNLPLPASMLI